jgi:hypothetical protein
MMMEIEVEVHFCLIFFYWVRVMGMVFNATFNNITVISWRSVLLVEETGVPRENHRSARIFFIGLTHELYCVCLKLLYILFQSLHMSG